jgi:hypothetical protein
VGGWNASQSSGYGERRVSAREYGLLTGEYEAFFSLDGGKTILQVSKEYLDISACEKELVKENFLKSFLRHRPMLAESCQDGAFDIIFNFTELGGLELSLSLGRPKRLVDRR